MYDALPSSLPAALASCYVLVLAYAAATVLLPSAAAAAAAGSVSELERRTVAQACVSWWRHYGRLPPRGIRLTWAELRARFELLDACSGGAFTAVILARALLFPGHLANVFRGSPSLAMALLACEAGLSLFQAAHAFDRVKESADCFRELFCIWIPIAICTALIQCLACVAPAALELVLCTWRAEVGQQRDEALELVTPVRIACMAACVLSAAASMSNLMEIWPRYQARVLSPLAHVFFRTKPISHAERLSRRRKAYGTRPGWSENYGWNVSSSVGDDRRRRAIAISGGVLSTYRVDYGWRFTETEGNRRRQAALDAYDWAKLSAFRKALQQEGYEIDYGASVDSSSGDRRRRKAVEKVGAFESFQT
jgi:hypothetical protein